MTIHRNSRIVHNDTVKADGTNGPAFQQPESLVDFGVANASGVRFHLDIHGTTGTFDYWELRVRFLLGMWDTLGAGDALQRWYPLQPEQIKTLITEGVDWYGGQQIPETITNLIRNSSWEISAGGTHSPGAGGAVTASRPELQGYLGKFARRITWTTGTTEPSGSSSSQDTEEIIAGQVYSASARFAASRRQRLRVGIIWYAGATRLSTSYGRSEAYASAQIRTGHRSTVTATAPPTATRAAVIVETVAGEGAANWEPGDTLDTDAFLLVAGEYLPPEFTGDSPDARWNGIPHESTSTLTVKAAAAGTGIVATSRDHLPVTVSREIRGFGHLVAVEIKPTFVKPSADAGITYSLNASY